MQNSWYEHTGTDTMHRYDTISLEEIARCAGYRTNPNDTLESLSRGVMMFADACVQTETNKNGEVAARDLLYLTVFLSLCSGIEP